MGHNRFRTVWTCREIEKGEPSQGVMTPTHLFLGL